MCLLTLVGKNYLFGFKIQYFEELMTEPETSSRYISFGKDKAWSGVIFDIKIETAVDITKLSTVSDKKHAQT